MIVEARIPVPASWGVKPGPIQGGGEVTFPPTGIVGRILKGHADARGAETELVLTLEIDEDSPVGSEIKRDALRGITTAEGPLFP